LRPYQRAAIETVEKTLGADGREMLVQEKFLNRLYIEALPWIIHERCAGARCHVARPCGRVAAEVL
jgi:hypothetical protein